MIYLDDAHSQKMRERGSYYKKKNLKWKIRKKEYAKAKQLDILVKPQRISRQKNAKVACITGTFHP